MRRALLTLSVLAILVMPFASSASKHQVAKWPVYRGAWFDVSYPVGFKVRPSLPANAGDGHDSAFFTSSDKKVQFYVFSPMVDGEPADIPRNPKTEDEVSSRTETRHKPFTDDPKNKTMVATRTTWVTVRAKDGRYTRSYVDIRETLGEGTPDDQVLSRRTFGIKYANRKVYDHYKKQYERFRKSLAQYAD